MTQSGLPSVLCGPSPGAHIGPPPGELNAPGAVPQPCCHLGHPRPRPQCLHRELYTFSDNTWPNIQFTLNAHLQNYPLLQLYHFVGFFGKFFAFTDQARQNKMGKIEPKSKEGLLFTQNLKTQKGWVQKSHASKAKKGLRSPNLSFNQLLCL